MAPYEVPYAIHDAGWLPDARINSLKGEEYGRQFVQEHWQFITDYFIVSIDNFFHLNSYINNDQLSDL